VPRRVALAAVHVGEGGEVHDRVAGGDPLAHLRDVTDVEVGVRESHHVRIAREAREERAREPAARAGDDEPHGVRARTASRCSRYHATVDASPSSNGMPGAHPSARRRASATP
jgi:hypothetical protein